MIKFFLSPARIKALLTGGGILLALAVSLFISTVYLYGQLGKEEARHATTRKELGAAELEAGRWKASAEAAKRQVLGLQDQVDACQNREARAAADAAARQAIMREAQPRERTAEERREVIDEATRQKAAARLNRPL